MDHRMFLMAVCACFHESNRDWGEGLSYQICITEKKIESAEKGRDVILGKQTLANLQDDNGS